MVEPCCTPSCCGGAAAPDDYPYPEQPYLDGSVDTFAGPVPRAVTRLSRADRLGALRVRMGIGRSDHRVRPGLYAVGAPTDESSVLVTANYRLSFDAVRSSMDGRDAWVLVLDTRGVNVWCAAGKKTFDTRELVARVARVRLAQVVSHRTLVVPQLGATGVSAGAVRSGCGFRVVWGPVRAQDVGPFLDAGMDATPSMRRVTFGLRERATLVPVEVSFLWRPRVLLASVAIAATAYLARSVLPSGTGSLALAALAGFLSGAVVTPLLLPWLPGRTFSLKGALVGALAGGAVAAARFGLLGPLRAFAVISIAGAVSSIAAMSFTGSSTFTSPSGVEREMRRALPLQGAALLAGAAAVAIGMVAA